MDVKSFVYTIILSFLKDAEYNENEFMRGIDLYIEDNGFYELTKNRFSENVTKSVIQKNLSEHLSGSKKETVLFFSNYELIEDVRIIDNRSLKLAERFLHLTNKTDADDSLISELSETERQFEALLKKIYVREGLKEMLKNHISEIVLNIDFAKGVSPYYSRRLRRIKHE